MYGKKEKKKRWTDMTRGVVSERGREGSTEMEEVCIGDIDLLFGASSETENCVASQIFAPPISLFLPNLTNLNAKLFCLCEPLGASLSVASMKTGRFSLRLMRRITISLFPTKFTNIPLATLFHSRIIPYFFWIIIYGSAPRM